MVERYFFPGNLQQRLRNGHGEAWAYQSHAKMDFEQLQQSQNTFEEGLVGTDGTLADFDTPGYLLQRGIINESEEAIKALETVGLHSDSFKDELVDIIVFISALFNHVGMSSAHLEALPVQAIFVEYEPPTTLELEAGNSLDETVRKELEQKQLVTFLLREKIITTSEEALDHLVLLGPDSTEFQNEVINILLFVIEILSVINVSHPELMNRTSRKVSVNFAKYRPDVMRGKTVAEGLKASRANFSRQLQ